MATATGTSWPSRPSSAGSRQAAISRSPTEPERVYVDALSGKDGRPLWWWHVDIPADQIHVPWHHPSGGAAARTAGRSWPCRSTAGSRQPWMSRYRPPSDPYPPMVTMLEASTGREVQTLRGFDQTHVGRPGRRRPDRPLGRIPGRPPRVPGRGARSLAGARAVPPGPRPRRTAVRRLPAGRRPRRRRHRRHPDRRR